MAKFCGKCGVKLDEKTGLCPKCDADKMNETSTQQSRPKIDNDSASETFSTKQNKKEEKKQKKFEKKAQKKVKKEEKRKKRENLSSGQKKRRTALRVVIIILVLSLLIIGCIGALAYFGVFNNNKQNTGGSNPTDPKVSRGDSDSVNLDNYKVENVDAKDYFAQNSKIVSEINVNDSKDILTESAVISELNRRGFKDYPITTEYNMNGEYHDASTVSNSSSDKHPVYQTDYKNSNGELWTISVINGVFIANPVSYNMQLTSGTQLVVSESNEITSYDNVTNKFYKTIPNESALTVKVMKCIDAETLDRLTMGELKK